MSSTAAGSAVVTPLGVPPIAATGTTFVAQGGVPFADVAVANFSAAPGARPTDYVATISAGNTCLICRHVEE